MSPSNAGQGGGPWGVPPSMSARMQAPTPRAEAKRRGWCWPWLAAFTGAALAAGLLVGYLALTGGMPL